MMRTIARLKKTAAMTVIAALLTLKLQFPIAIGILAGTGVAAAVGAIVAGPIRF